MPQKTIEADETLKRRIDNYRRLRQEMAALKDQIDPLKEEFKALEECVILYEGRKLASQAWVHKKEYVVAAQDVLTFRCH